MRVFRGPLFIGRGLIKQQVVAGGFSAPNWKHMHEERRRRRNAIDLWTVRVNKTVQLDFNFQPGRRGTHRPAKLQKGCQTWLEGAASLSGQQARW